MFHDSTQRKYWLFDSAADLTRRRDNVNRQFKDKMLFNEPHQGCSYLTVKEEVTMVTYHIRKLLEFCTQFKPPVPRSAIGTAVTYLKRFYLVTSVMDFHPKDIYLACAFVAFKVEEYNLSADAFAEVLPKEHQKKIADFVLAVELTIMQKLAFHMIVHSPFRPLEGFLVDMKTKCPQIPSPDSLRKVADKFLMHSFYSDVSLLYPPSQLALAALRHSAIHQKVDIDVYIKGVLLSKEEASKVDSLMKKLEEIEAIVKKNVIPLSKIMQPIELKLSQCRNNDNNPDNERFWRKRKKDKTSDTPPNKKRKTEEAEGEGCDSEDIFGPLAKRK